MVINLPCNVSFSPGCSTTLFATADPGNGSNTVNVGVPRMKALTRSDVVEASAVFVVIIEVADSTNANPSTIAIGFFEFINYLIKRKDKRNTAKH